MASDYMGKTIRGGIAIVVLFVMLGVISDVSGQYSFSGTVATLTDVVPTLFALGVVAAIVVGLYKGLN